MCNSPDSVYGLTAVFGKITGNRVDGMPRICVNASKNEPWTEILPEDVANGTTCCIQSV